MRNIYIPLIVIILINILPLKPYVECNKLHIIKSIKVTCNNKYEITYKEIIPEKEENGIKFHYEIYTSFHQNLDEAIKQIENNKKIYKYRANIEIKNCKNKKEIINLLH